MREGLQERTKTGPAMRRGAGSVLDPSARGRLALAGEERPKKARGLEVLGASRVLRRKRGSCGVGGESAWKRWLAISGEPLRSELTACA
jgi:hypothetical protein